MIASGSTLRRVATIATRVTATTSATAMTSAARGPTRNASPILPTGPITRHLDPSADGHARGGARSARHARGTRSPRDGRPARPGRTSRPGSAGRVGAGDSQQPLDRALDGHRHPGRPRRPSPARRGSPGRPRAEPWPAPACPGPGRRTACPGTNWPMPGSAPRSTRAASASRIAASASRRGTKTRKAHDRRHRRLPQERLRDRATRRLDLAVERHLELVGKRRTASDEVGQRLQHDPELARPVERPRPDDPVATGPPLRGAAGGRLGFDRGRW